jgi:formiminoglutamase
MMTPPRIDLPPERPDDPRVGRLLGRKLADPSAARVALVGFPVDEGVWRNGGRVGASDGPAAIRRQLYRLTPDPRHYETFVELIEHTADLGDVAATDDLEADQRELGEVVAGLLRCGTVPVVLGGGHETSYGHFLGYVAAGVPVAILNWDAHPDVRPLIDGKGHSGSPFRQALAHGPAACRRYRVFGLSPFAVAAAHLDFLAANRGEFRFYPDLDPANLTAAYRDLPGDTLTTFDLDAVDGAHAPGVSAPAADGLSPALWLEAAFLAGRCPQVRSMDVVELNPRYDPDDRTARLAALTVWKFLQGLAGRGV